MGSILSWDLNDRPDLENRALQAKKALQAMMPNVFRNPHVSTHVKRMLYMAIPMNLLLWGCETWALKESDWNILRVFHTSSIRRIFNLSMAEVQENRIRNVDLYPMFEIDPIDNIVASRQLRWLGKIAMMKETRLPRKFINAWHPNPRPVGRPLTTIRHTYLRALKLIDELDESDSAGKLDGWMRTIRLNPPDWETRRLALTPHIIGFQSPTNIE
uniref:Endonuclease-reverse transcriptase n=2 Tax=Helicotheca tamesis TaxID=374047 RepID=A0A7S2I8R2_9STRA